MCKEAIPLIVYKTNQDDKKKCSARKLAKFGFAVLEKKIDKLPYGCVLLDPFAKKAFSKEDLNNAKTHGLLAIDCSWKNAEEIFLVVKKRKKTVSRALPFLLATNPLNFGKPFKLTTLEAFAGALYILGYSKQCEKILGIYNWGKNFLKVNKEPLELYGKAVNSKEIIKFQELFL